MNSNKSMNFAIFLPLFQVPKKLRKLFRMNASFCWRLSFSSRKWRIKKDASLTWTTVLKILSRPQFYAILLHVCDFQNILQRRKQKVHKCLVQNNESKCDEYTHGKWRPFLLLAGHIVGKSFIQTSEYALFVTFHQCIFLFIFTVVLSFQMNSPWKLTWTVYAFYSFQDQDSKFTWMILFLWNRLFFQKISWVLLQTKPISFAHCVKCIFLSSSFLNKKLLFACILIVRNSLSI